MALQEQVRGCEGCFMLVDKTPGSEMKLLCQPLEEEDRPTWISHLRSQLNMQADFLSGKSVASFTHFVTRTFNHLNTLSK